jgi:hypothetical protein
VAIKLKLWNISTSDKSTQSLEKTRKSNWNDSSPRSNKCFSYCTKNSISRCSSAFSLCIQKNHIFCRQQKDEFSLRMVNDEWPHTINGNNNISPWISTVKHKTFNHQSFVVMHHRVSTQKLNCFICMTRYVNNNEDSFLFSVQYVCCEMCKPHSNLLEGIFMFASDKMQKSLGKMEWD